MQEEGITCSYLSLTKGLPHRSILGQALLLPLYINLDQNVLNAKSYAHMNKWSGYDRVDVCVNRRQERYVHADQMKQELPELSISDLNICLIPPHLVSYEPWL